MGTIYFFAKSQKIKYLRIDTHLDNKIMKKFLSRFEFSVRGNLKLSIRNILDNEEIITYELKVNQRKSFM